jgi:transcriptional antiterminator RfaH
MPSEEKWPAWGVVQTQPHRERLAVEHLTRQEFRTYCPMVKVQRRRGQGFIESLRPLFPNYVFIELLNANQRWRPVSSTFGVRKLITFGDRPGLIADAFITALKAREQDGVIARPRNPYQIGQQVKISQGPFEGIVGTILSVGERDRLVILLSLMQRGVEVRLDSDQVIAA